MPVCENDWAKSGLALSKAPGGSSIDFGMPEAILDVTIFGDREDESSILNRNVDVCDSVLGRKESKGTSNTPLREASIPTPNKL